MALHSVDKSNINGQSPSPNTPDRLITDAPPAHNTVSTHYSVNTPTGYVQMRNKQVIANDGTDNVGLFGYNNALDAWGIFQTKAGTDVTTNTDLSKFIFNSTQDTFKIVKTGTHTVTYSFSSHSGSGQLTESQDDTIAHNLGYIPAVVAFSTVTYNSTTYNSPVSNGSIWQYQFGGGTGFCFALWQNDIYADSTNLYLGVSRWTNFGNGAYSSSITSQSSSVTYRYYLLQETSV